MKIKICGITNIDDGLAACEAGADFLGFVFYPPSPRYTPPDTAARIIERLPSSIQSVGVFVNDTVKNVISIAKTAALNLVQLHGDGSAGNMGCYPTRVIKSIRFTPDRDLPDVSGQAIDYILLDAYNPKLWGGAGAPMDWKALDAALAHNAGYSDHRIFLAGGLNADNVAEAIQTIKPFAVDVSSGVESAPGKKSPLKIKEFINVARSAI